MRVRACWNISRKWFKLHAREITRAVRQLLTNSLDFSPFLGPRNLVYCLPSSPSCLFSSDGQPDFLHKQPPHYFDWCMTVWTRLVYFSGNHRRLKICTLVLVRIQGVAGPLSRTRHLVATHTTTGRAVITWEGRDVLREVVETSLQQLTGKVAGSIGLKLSTTSSST